MIGLKKKKKRKRRKKERLMLKKKKETHIDNREFDFGLKFLLIFFLLYMAYKPSLSFWRKIKDATYVFQPKEQ